MNNTETNELIKNVLLPLVEQVEVMSETIESMKESIANINKDISELKSNNNENIIKNDLKWEKSDIPERGFEIKELIKEIENDYTNKSFNEKKKMLIDLRKNIIELYIEDILYNLKYFNNKNLNELIGDLNELLVIQSINKTTNLNQEAFDNIKIKDLEFIKSVKEDEIDSIIKLSLYKYYEKDFTKV